MQGTSLGATPLPIHSSYIKGNENKIWVATFQDVVKYIRQRMASSTTHVMESIDKNEEGVSLDSSYIKKLSAPGVGKCYCYSGRRYATLQNIQ